MPGAREVVREDLRQIDAEEAGQVGAVVLRGAAHQRLDEEQGRHHQEEVRRGALGRGERHLAGGEEREPLLLAPVPAEEVPAAERGEQQADAARAAR